MRFPVARLFVWVAIAVLIMLVAFAPATAVDTIKSLVAHMVQFFETIVGGSK